MNKHTPGPWLIGALESGQAAVDGADGSEVTGFISIPDARLITAAPDLLAACEACMTLLVRYENKTIAPEVGTGAAIDAAHAAIAKARGER